MKIRPLNSARQRLYSPDVLFDYPAGQSDSFTAYIKAACLISRVKVFNQRLPKKIIPLSSELANNLGPNIRQLQEFIETERLIAKFGASVNLYFPGLTTEEPFDSRLYLVRNTPHL
jgi:hypothetical protein